MPNLSRGTMISITVLHANNGLTLKHKPSKLLPQHDVQHVYAMRGRAHSTVRQMTLRLPSPQVTMFTSIGVINTLVDFIVYLTVLHFTNSILIANIMATSVALAVSFVLNSRFTFKIRGLSPSRFMAFIGVTLFGTWVLQTLVIYGVTPLVAAIPAAAFAALGPLSVQAERLLPKLIATVFSLVWNYIWYSKVIFVAPNKKR